MMASTLNHKSVLNLEAINLLQVNTGTYVDGTLGAAGHSLAILKQLKNGLLISIDQDATAIAKVQNENKMTSNWKIVNDNFSNIETILNNLGVKEVNGVILDLGMSSMQLDNPNRGFSYHENAPLDMRMDGTSDFSAKNIINEYTEEQLAKIFYLYADSKFSKSIAKNIVKARTNKPIETNFELIEVIKKSMPAKLIWKKHPAKTIFQALRIETNKELESLTIFLNSIIKFLAKDAILVFISFHSLEDKLVKNFFDSIINKDQAIAKLPINSFKQFKWISKAVKPSAEEINENSRAKSAIMRAVQFKGVN